MSKENWGRLKGAVTRRYLISAALQWLYPGLKIKRWLLLAAAGLAAALLGFALLVGPDLHGLSGRVAPLFSYLRGSFYSGLLLACGLFLMVLGLQRAAGAVKEVLSPHPERPLIDLLFTRRYLERGPRIVTIGGGTGLSTLLRELKKHTSNLTAVVTVTDDGGSSGRLRGELGIPPPGDIRNCLLALADTEPLMEQLFQHRFAGGHGLGGHSFGNLFIAAMTELFGFEEAVKLFGQVLAIRGRVYPVTAEIVRLEAEDVDGLRISGQSALYHRVGPLKRIALVPPDVKPLPEVLEAIAEADAVVLGPGSLFTSVLPNLLVSGVTGALLHCRGPVFYVCNVMTQPGETTGFTAADHVRALLDHSAPSLLDYVIVNSDLSIPAGLLEPYRREGADLVRPDYRRLREMVPVLISGPFIDRRRVGRHNGALLARVIIEQVAQGKAGGVGGSRLARWGGKIRRRLGVQGSASRSAAEPESGKRKGRGF